MTFRKPLDSTWANAITMLEQAERLHRQFFRLSSGRSTGPTWEPLSISLKQAAHYRCWWLCQGSHPIKSM